MIRKILIVAYFCALCGTMLAQNVTNITVEQVGKNIVVSYDLEKAATISMCYSTDGGKTFSSPMKQVTGDVGKGVSAGHKQITWNVLNELEKLVCSNLVFKVIAGGGNETFTVKGVSFEMVFVEGGTFTMGATGIIPDFFSGGHDMPSHSVTLSDYYIGKYEVTQGLWEAVMGNNSSYFKGSTRPVEQVSWDDCQTFVSKLNSLLSSQLGGKCFALPTEAQWEYAARGGKKSLEHLFAGGNSIDFVAWIESKDLTDMQTLYGNSIDSVAWIRFNSDNSTHEVGTKSPNELGVYDMCGNVWEWCQDWYGDYSSSSQTNPKGASSGSRRVVKGNSWDGDIDEAYVSNRFGIVPSSRDYCLGLRLVLVP